jgi:hypothetical protein
LGFDLSPYSLEKEERAARVMDANELRRGAILAQAKVGTSKG